jgi:hypothetical protein
LLVSAKAATARCTGLIATTVHSYVAKFYFQRTADGLDRLDVEFSSMQIALGGWRA